MSPSKTLAMRHVSLRHPGIGLFVFSSSLATFRVLLFVSFIALLDSASASDWLSQYGSFGLSESDKGAEGMKYFHINYQGNYTVALRSLEGDADLYIQENGGKPSPKFYKESSTTCDIDVVYISHEQKFPVVIGVYQYSYHTNVKYHLRVTDEFIPISQLRNESESLFKMSDIIEMLLPALEFILEVLSN
eukprot:Nk52_evm67s215 gene=Nk52_evmTU67s215